MKKNEFYYFEVLNHELPKIYQCSTFELFSKFIKLVMSATLDFLSEYQSNRPNQDYLQDALAPN